LMAATYGELTGHRDLIAFDMGGTTAKLALVENGRPDTTTAFELHRVNGAAGSGLPMNIQAIDLVEIGAGGGSIARVNLGVTAAIGLLAAEVKFDVARTWVRRFDALDPAALTTMYDDMAAQAASIVRGAAVAGTVTLARSVDARYVGQGYELTVPVPSGALDAAALARIRAAFDEVYAARYGYANPTEPVETVTWKLAA